MVCAAWSMTTSRFSALAKGCPLLPNAASSAFSVAITGPVRAAAPGFSGSGVGPGGTASGFPSGPSTATEAT